MKKCFMITMVFCLAELMDSSVIAQDSCIIPDSSQKKLYLNGSNFTLIDNALRCFKLNSIADEHDSLVRIWILEDNFPDTPTVWCVKMFEFGKKEKLPFATLHVLEWVYENAISFSVKCIKDIRLDPENGWLAFNRDIRSVNLSELYKKPLINDGFVIVDYGMLIIQFLFGHTTHTVDFTGLVNVFHPINTLQLDHSKRITYLFWFIEKHFSTKLSVDAKGRNFLEDATKRLNIKKQK